MALTQTQPQTHHRRAAATPTGRLFDLGYAGRPPTELAALLPPGTLVVDVRREAWSIDPSWSTGTRATVEAQGFGYLHLPELGNLDGGTGGGAGAGSQRAIELVLETLRQARDVALMCACRQLASCHRRLLAQEAQRRLPGLRVTSL